MVAQKVEIDTFPIKKGHRLFYDGSPEFRLEDSPEKAGTVTTSRKKNRNI